MNKIFNSKFIELISVSDIVSVVCILYKAFSFIIAFLRLLICVSFKILIPSYAVL